MTLMLPSDRDEFRSFERFYDDEIAPYLAGNEQSRRKAVKKFATTLGGAVFFALIVLFFLPWESVRMEVSLITVAMGGSLGYAFVSKVRSQITDGLLQRVCAFFSYAYRREMGRPNYCRDFDRLKLLPNFNREHWEDEVRGERHGASFTLCEAHLKYRTSGKNKRTKTVFHGQLLVIDYHKEFLGETVLKRDAGVFNRFMKPGKQFQRVGIASSKFEKIFEAWSTDQVEARDILDPLVLERFEELDRLFGGAKLRAAFSKGKLFLALEVGDKLNMGSMFKPLQGKDRVEKLLKEFDLIFDLIDVLLKRIDTRLDGALSVQALKTA